MKPADFLDAIVPAAQACHAATGIPASFTIAQAALESAWGASKLANSGHNLFGVKADPSWKGATVVLQTREVIKGESVMVMAKWRCYATWLECLTDRALFFRQNKRYAACFKATSGPDWCRAVAAAGYATDPQYAEKLLAMIKGRDLERFDVIAKTVKP